MADWTNTGYERSLKITITKVADNLAATTTFIYLDGTLAFDAYPAIDDTTFSHLTDSEYNARVNAWKIYLHNTWDLLEPGMIDKIFWTDGYRASGTVPISNNITLTGEYVDGEPMTTLTATSQVAVASDVTILFSWVRPGFPESTRTIVIPTGSTSGTLTITSATSRYREVYPTTDASYNYTVIDNIIYPVA